MEEVILQTTNLTKQYKDKLAVNKINMTINKGDIYGFIGKNGAGKTSTMKLILGLTIPSDGKIELFGSSVLDKGRARIGSLIEAPGLYKNETAYENMKRFSILTNSNDKEIKEYLELVGLGNTGKKKAGEFSLGMKQRLGIAIALLGKPELLILDEPINGLDPEGIKEIRDIIIKLNKEYNVTFLISSHLLDELAKIVTKYGIINNGVLVEEIEAKTLEERCQSSLIIKCNNPKLANQLLKKAIPNVNITIKDNELILDKGLDSSAKINTLLVNNKIEVSEIKISHEDFENYFIERIGR